MRVLNQARVLAALLVFAIPSSLLAQEAGLSDEQQREFTRQRLVVETQQRTVVMVPTDLPVAGAQTSKTWTPYRGFNRIAEADFYRIAGYHEEAQRIESYRTTARTLALGGGIACVVGIGIMLAATGPSYMEIGILGGLVAGGGGIASIMGLSRLNRSVTTVGQAIQVADEFNRQLLRELTQTHR